MNFFAIIAAAAGKMKVPVALMFAICKYESANFTDILVHDDGGSASMGICMVKLETAQMLGYKGTAEVLRENHRVNATYAAKYLAKQISRYGDDWVKVTAAYNAGSYNPSKVAVGCPRNLEYVSRVRKRLDKDSQYRLHCGVTVPTLAETELLNKLRVP